MSALDELVNKYPWWDLAEFILWVGTRDPEIIARSRAFSDKRRLERVLDELGKRPAYNWWRSARHVILAGELEVIYSTIEDGPRKVEPHEFPYLEFMLELKGGGPYLYRKNAILYSGRLNAALVKATSIVTAFPPETPAIAVVGSRGGPPSAMPAIEAELDRWIAGGTPLVLSRMQHWAPMTRDTRTKDRLALALSNWSEKAGGDTAKSTIQKVLSKKLDQALERIK
jgi:hypothetical protein